ncbi:MAG: hypothetical protein HY301_02570 [Verrucomicrobia bacterium]|nr:hypothetical protein [Verrucomicrobiota bacterium]
MKLTPLVSCTALLLAWSIALSAAEPKSLAQSVLERADKNKDGKLALAEYQPLDAQAKHHGEEHFKAGDQNGDGFLDVAELHTTLQKQTWYALLSEGVPAAFKRADADHDGKLSPAEYRTLSRMGGHAEQHFNHADTNHDGSLSLAELEAHATAWLKPLEPGLPRSADK